jgi:hypothetical protein
MGWQTNRILETIGTATGGTQSINFNLEAIEALLVTLQADVADGIRPFLTPQLAELVLLTSPPPATAR